MKMLEAISKIENNSLLRHVIVPPLFSLLWSLKRSLPQRRRRLSSPGIYQSTKQFRNPTPSFWGLTFKNMARTAAEIAEVGVDPPFGICRTLLCLVTLLKRARQAFTLEEPGITFEQALRRRSSPACLPRHIRMDAGGAGSGAG